MIRLYKTPFWLPWFFPSHVWRTTKKNTIHLTFDDGPHPETTPWLLDLLDIYNAQATFFLVGKQVEQYPELTQDIRNRGHQIGNHSYTHLHGWRTSVEAYATDVARCSEVLRRQGIQAHVFRPPYGKLKKRQMKNLSGLSIVMWTFMAWDFVEDLNISRCLRQLKKAKEGSILVFHENDKSKKTIRRILPPLIEHFKQKKYRLKSIT